MMMKIQIYAYHNHQRKSMMTTITMMVVIRSWSHDHYTMVVMIFMKVVKILMVAIVVVMSVMTSITQMLSA